MKIFTAILVSLEFFETSRTLVWKSHACSDCSVSCCFTCEIGFTNFLSQSIVKKIKSILTEEPEKIKKLLNLRYLLNLLEMRIIYWMLQMFPYYERKQVKQI